MDVALESLSISCYNRVFMTETEFTILDLLNIELKGFNALNLKCLSGRRGLSNVIKMPDINRPGLALSGFYDSFAYYRVQIFGRGEVAYVNKQINENNTQSLHQFFAYNIPCCIFTHSLVPNKEMTAIADGANCPILQTDIESTDFSSRLLRVLSNIFAPRKSIHGVLAEVYGIGILILGDSGVGKSETALDLIERGHRLVADDIVELHCVNGNTIVGQGSNRMISHHMEIRGLGIINISQLYGIGSIRQQKEVQLVIKITEWDSNRVYDRLGTEQIMFNVLGVDIPLIEMPVKPGRNLPILIETAAKNERLKGMGYYSAVEFNKNVLKWIESGQALNAYYDYGDADAY
ncbi:MAG: HPr(Ser) kinase/phosphatase [Treponemataceae bacterium]|nr:MAG: HPr(Ser) kinase/phosphatase [Treponemataceae bacterium]